MLHGLRDRSVHASIYIKFFVCLSVCMCVRYARPNQWPDLDQTWHEGSLPPGAQLRGVKVGGGPQGAEPPGENPIFTL